MQALQEKTQTIVYLPGEGKSVTVAGEVVTFKAVSADTNGAWTLLEFHVPPHFAGPPLHWHGQEIEAFYILSGTVTMQFEERAIKAPAGAFALVPPGVVHTFSNQEDVPATFLTFLSPGGFEGFIEELGETMRQETTWPPADMSKYAALNTKYGIYPPSARSNRP
ncbi:MAG: cupin domain-containing protein [Anaerolineae bacterium]|nr:cupin domain-containing protein [Anaerolineae bacterium]